MLEQTHEEQNFEADIARDLSHGVKVHSDTTRLMQSFVRIARLGVVLTILREYVPIKRAKSGPQANLNLIHGNRRRNWSLKH